MNERRTLSGRRTGRRALQRLTHLPSTAWCSLKHYALKQRSRPVGPVDEAVVDEVLAGYDDDVVFVHAGLSDIKTALQTNPYEALMEKLEDAFESVLAPGFTHSFRETGVFDVEETPPELGAFSGLFFQDADYRTPDPLHSVLVSGSYRFDGCSFRDTFGPESPYAQLSAENVLYLNVGTPWLISTQIHYIERICDVPYADTITIDGELVVDGDTEPISQRNYEKNNYLYFWNRRKLRDELVAAGVMDHYSLNGLNVMGVRAGDMERFLVDRIEQDPYYLVR
ncbi:MAG: AAC(3) family N-acetyltransferase [Halohasta sp.]